MDPAEADHHESVGWDHFQIYSATQKLVLRNYGARGFPNGEGWGGKVNRAGKAGCPSAPMAAIEQDFQAEQTVKPTRKIVMRGRSVAL